MTSERLRNDPYRADFGEDLGRAPALEDALRFDADVAEGPGDGTKVALIAVALALLMGALFYGLSNWNSNEADNSPAVSNRAGPPAAQLGMHHVSLRKSSMAPGVTTGTELGRPVSPQADVRH